MAEGRVGHAYLFSGPRGTGKTSAARILAMAANCEAPLGGEPCGGCQACRAVRLGSSLDVVEVDAASKRLLDDMRDLLASVGLASPGRRKFYIIDEVHQLTPHAAAALLKTLEEPPSHVVFVLATTDPQAVLETIRSRCQHFTFNLLAEAALSELVRSVADDAGLGLPAEALAAAVAEGAGSARDALSALERIAMGGGTRATLPAARLAQALAARDPSAILTAVAEAVACGFAPHQIAHDLLAYLRQAFLSTFAPNLAAPDNGKALGLARQMGLPCLVRTMETLGKTGALSTLADPRASLEAALLACAASPGPNGLDALAERITRLEAALGGSGQAPTPPRVLLPLGTVIVGDETVGPIAAGTNRLAAAATEPPAGMSGLPAAGTGPPGPLGRLSPTGPGAAAPDALARMLQRVKARHIDHLDGLEPLQRAPQPEAPGCPDDEADDRAVGSLAAAPAEALASASAAALSALEALMAPLERAWVALEALTRSAADNISGALGQGQPQPPSAGAGVPGQAGAPARRPSEASTTAPASPPSGTPTGDPVQVLLGFFPGAVEVTGADGMCASCGAVLASPLGVGQAKRGLCLTCYERTRAR